MVMLKLKPQFTMTLGGEDVPNHSVSCSTLKEAAQLLRQFVERHNLGASQLSKACGTVKDQTGGIVAYVSYNGRLWGPDGRLLQ